jgi:hypothetical protein
MAIRPVDSSSVLEKRHKPEIHVQLLAAVEERQLTPRIRFDLSKRRYFLVYQRLCLGGAEHQFARLTALRALEFAADRHEPLEE